MTVLFDSNVLVAAAITDHTDRPSSLAALEATSGRVALHSLSEVYNTLTKPKLYAREPKRAAAIVAGFSRSLDIVGLTQDEHLDAIAQFAILGGLGARLYDFLIGSAARKANLRTIVTLNASHFVPLFPELIVLTPTQYLETL